MLKNILILLIIVFTLQIKISSKKFTENELNETLKFWTDEKLENARPIHELLSDKEFKQIYPNLNKKEIDTDYVKPEELYAVHPYKTVGKLFFRVQNRGYAYCSGSSTGNNALLTGNIFIIY